MGEKGAKLTAAAEVTAHTLEGRLESLGQVSSRKMFGGFGLFQDGKMFGIVNSHAELFFKVDDETVEEYRRAGSHQHGKMPYYSVPGDVLSDDTQLLKWGHEAVGVAHG